MANFRGVSIAEDKTGNILLSGVHGIIPEYGILGLIGASGCGKSLFMRSISGLVRDCNFKGEVCFRKRKKLFGQFDSYFSYNEYNDSNLMGTLSPIEILRFRSYLTEKYNRNTEKEISGLLSLFFLADVSTSNLSPWLKPGLSEPQRRLLNICKDLICPASILLLDDVFSGLDSLITYDVLTTLRNMQKDKKISIVLSIHQPTPRILEMFDQILILGAHKQMSFFGTNRDLQNFIGRIGQVPLTNVEAETSPVDFFLNLIDAQNEEMEGKDDDFTQIPRRGSSLYRSMFLADPLYTTLMESLEVN